MEDKEILLLSNLKGVEERLKEDIQAIFYIDEEATIDDKGFIDVNFIKNGIRTLLKSMIYNQHELQNVINSLKE